MKNFLESYRAGTLAEKISSVVLVTIMVLSFVQPFSLVNAVVVNGGANTLV